MNKNKLDCEMQINENDQLTMAMIDSQVEKLLSKNAPDYAIVNSLASFVPEAKCLLNSAEKSELSPYLVLFPNFH